MTSLNLVALPVVALGTPANAGDVSPWVQFLPFALALAIVYFVLLLPMKRRQKKVQTFLDSLKVGDRVITTGGMYGTIVKMADRSVKLQVADKVNIEISKAAIAGLQGQEPVVTDNSQA
jgi:preprotein translocase subunit YajC